MKTHKIPLPKIDKPEFGNVEQINAIREYQRKVEEDTWRVRVDYCGGYVAEIKAKDENQALDLAYEEGERNICNVEVEVEMIGKLVSEDEKEKINPNNLSLFKGEVI